MGNQAAEGRSVAGRALLLALVLAASACAPPNPEQVQQQPSPTEAVSPLPTPTTPLAVSTLPFHSGEVGVDYTPVALAATGGVSPYSWSISVGALPGGLTLGSDGKISGTPSSAGTFSFTVQVADSAGGTAGLPGTIGIAARISVSLIAACASVCAVELGCDSTCGAFGQLSGGVGPYTYSRSGPLPNGTTLSGLRLTGTFTGIPGYVQFTVVVTDKLGGQATISPTFYLFPHISLASGTCSGNYITGCTVRLKISGGTPNATPTAKRTSVGPAAGRGCWGPDTTPPLGSSFSVGGGYLTVTIPSGLINGYGAVWTFVLTDKSLCSAGAYCKSAAATVAIGVQCG